MTVQKTIYIYIYISSSFLPSLNPKFSYSTKIKSLEGVINLVPGSQDFPISLSCFIPTGFLSVFFFLNILETASLFLS